MKATNLTWALTCKMDEAFGLPGYKDYIELHFGEAMEVFKNHGSMHDLDNIVLLEDILGFNVSYELYSYIDGRAEFEDTAISELDDDDYKLLMEMCCDYVLKGDGE